MNAKHIYVPFRMVTLLVVALVVPAVADAKDRRGDGTWYQSPAEAGYIEALIEQEEGRKAVRRQALHQQQREQADVDEEESDD